MTKMNNEFVTAAILRNNVTYANRKEYLEDWPNLILCGILNLISRDNGKFGSKYSININITYHTGSTCIELQPDLEYYLTHREKDAMHQRLLVELKGYLIL